MSKEQLFAQARKTGKSAQQSNILAARIIAETVKSTLGPKGMDKILIDEQNNITVTNDGATIVGELASDHPVARMITEIALAQEENVGDGTTTAVLLAGELLRRAEELLEQKVHPTVIIKGYQFAAAKALETLTQHSKKVEFTEETLTAIAKTAMTGKGAEVAQDVLVPLVVNAALTLESLSLSFIIQPGLSANQSRFVPGIMLEKTRAHPQMPISISNPKIALLTCPIELAHSNANISIQTPEQLQAFMDSEESTLKSFVETLTKHGVTCVCTSKGIDELAQHYLAQKGIYAIRRVPGKELSAIKDATGAQILSTIADVRESTLGSAQKISQEAVNDAQYTVISGTKYNSHGTLLIAGATRQVADEMARAVEDALGDIRVLKINEATKRVVAGAGAIDMQLSLAVSKLAIQISGKEQLAVNAFAKSLEVVPHTLAENAGLDPIDMLSKLRVSDSADTPKGIDVMTGDVINPFDTGIIEPISVKEHVIKSATEVATMVLRIDDIIFTTPLPTQESEGLPKQ